MSEVSIRDFVDVESFDHNLLVAQMWDYDLLTPFEYDFTTPFEGEDDLDPDLVRISLGCGNKVVSMDSLDRFVEKYPHYQFSEKVIDSIVYHCTPSRIFAEHVFRTTPDNAEHIIYHHKAIEKHGIGIVESSVELDPHNALVNHKDMESLKRMGVESFIEECFRIDNGTILLRVMAHPDTPDWVKHIIEGGVNVGEDSFLCRALSNSPHATTEFLSKVARYGFDSYIKSAAQGMLMHKEFYSS